MPRTITTLTHMSSISRLFIFLLAGTVLYSCKTNQRITQQSVYFMEISDSMLLKAAQAYEPVLQKGDILSIVVITPNESSSKLFNRPTASGMAASGEGSAGSAATGGGYLIDEKGNISIPYVGYVKAAG